MVLTCPVARERVIAAGNAGIYVAVMLFDGFALHLSPAPDNVQGHPFYHANNINAIGISSIVDEQVLPLEPRVQELQETYIRKVVDTVHNLPNVLYEVANESSGGGSVDKSFAEAMGLNDVPDWGDSTEWQYWVINTLKQYEQHKGYTIGAMPQAASLRPSATVKIRLATCSNAVASVSVRCVIARLVSLIALAGCHHLES